MRPWPRQAGDDPALGQLHNPNRKQCQLFVELVQWRQQSETGQENQPEHVQPLHSCACVFAHEESFARAISLSRSRQIERTATRAERYSYRDYRPAVFLTRLSEHLLDTLYRAEDNLLESPHRRAVPSEGEEVPHSLRRLGSESSLSQSCYAAVCRRIRSNSVYQGFPLPGLRF